jgi:hypothetical protein
MSDHTHDSDGGEEVNYSKVIGVGVGSLVIFAASIWWASTIWRGETEKIEAAVGKAKTFDIHQQEIGIVDQVPFSIDTRFADWHRARLAHLNSTGWVDKTKGVVHIPIQFAIQQVIAGGAPAGAPK